MKPVPPSRLLLCTEVPLFISGHCVDVLKAGPGPLLSWCLTSTETIRLIRDGRMEVGEERDYMPIATLPPPE